MMFAVEGVEVVSDTILKPFSSPSLPSHPLHNAQIPLTPFDMANYDCHVCILYAFRGPMPDNAAMREGLAKALTLFPHLAGRFVPDEQGYPHVVVNDAGVRLKEATVPTSLDEHLPFNASASFLNLHPHPAEGVETLMQIQLTRFSCGGLVLGLTSHHRIGDGNSMCHFLHTWAKLVRGLDVGPLPYFDWAAVCAPRDPPRSEFDHVGVEFKQTPPLPAEPVNIFASLARMQNISVHFSKEFIAQLKGKVTGGDPNKRASTFLSVLTHVWKKTTLARGLQDDEVTRVRLAVNGRQRMTPSVPPEYFGNLVLWAHPKMTAGELLEASYGRVAQSIRDAVNVVDDTYFKSFLDFGQSLRGKKGRELVCTMPQVGDFLNPNIEFNSWLTLQFHELDFATGAPCAFIPPGLPVEGLMILVPSCGDAGGVDIYMALEREHAATLSTGGEWFTDDGLTKNLAGFRPKPAVQANRVSDSLPGSKNLRPTQPSVMRFHTQACARPALSPSLLSAARSRPALRPLLVATAAATPFISLTSFGPGSLSQNTVGGLLTRGVDAPAARTKKTPLPEAAGFGNIASLASLSSLGVPSQHRPCSRKCTAALPAPFAASALLPSSLALRGSLLSSYPNGPLAADI